MFVPISPLKRSLWICWVICDFPFFSLSSQGQKHDSDDCLCCFIFARCVCVYSNVLISTKWQHPPFVRALRVVRIPDWTYFRSVFLSGAVLVGDVGHTWALRDPEQQLPSPSEFVFGYYSPRANAANFCSSMPYAAEFSSCICSLWVACWIWVSRFALIAFSHPEPLLAGRQCFSAASKSVTYDCYSVVSYACFWKAICYKLRSVRASGLQACCGV